MYDALRRAIEARGLGGRCDVGWQSCFGFCTRGPNVLVRDVTPPAEDGTQPGSRVTALYNGVDVVNIEAVVEQHLEQGVVVRALVFGVRS